MRLFVVVSLLLCCCTLGIHAGGVVTGVGYLFGSSWMSSAAVSAAHQIHQASVVGGESVVTAAGLLGSSSARAAAEFKFALDRASSAAETITGYHLCS